MNKPKTRGLMFTRDERSRNGKVRVSIKDVGGVLKVRKWNYRLQKWGRWAKYA